jgi:hypothetical protein
MWHRLLTQKNIALCRITLDRSYHLVVRFSCIIPVSDYQRRSPLSHEFEPLFLFSKGQNISWIAISRSYGQNISCHFWNPKVHCRIHKSLPQISILCQMSPADNISHFVGPISVFSSYLLLSLPRGSSPSRFRIERCVLPFLLTDHWENYTFRRNHLTTSSGKEIEAWGSFRTLVNTYQTGRRMIEQSTFSFPT